MSARRVLIVDDEKNIRMTLRMALEPLGLETDAAVNGEEALQKLQANGFELILLDLKMPGMDGMEVLHAVRDLRPDVAVIVITAHGTIDSAVEAMKLGAVDFIQKPFAPDEIRELVGRVLDRPRLESEAARDYGSHLELGKRSIQERHFEAARAHLRRAIADDAGRPEAFNLLGVLLEMRGDKLEAQKNYRAALALDPSYAPADANLQRSMELVPQGGYSLGEEGSGGAA